jgi:hypothetical protein
MAVVNPFAGDPERALAWEQGFLAGYAEPDEEHFPPLEGELLEVFFQGEGTGRTDRANEPSSQDPVPSSSDSDVTRFESAPDGTLIPIPDEVPQGNPILEEAEVAVSLQGNGTFFYVVIYNKKDEDESEVEAEKRRERIAHVLTEAAIKRFEHFLAETVLKNAKGIVKFGVGIAIGVVVSVLTTSPILKERRFRGYTGNLTPIDYVILEPQ